MKNLINKIVYKKLYYLAKLTIWRYKPTVIGITGNVGKTSTKLAVKSVLGHSMKTRASRKNFNDNRDVLLSIVGDYKKPGGFFFFSRVIFSAFLGLFFQVPGYPEVLVLDYGVDRPGDMNSLLNIARPKIGIVTAMGDTPIHIEFFANKDAVVREKTKLINQLPATGYTLLNRDDKTVMAMKEKTRAHTLTFGFDSDSDLKITTFETVWNEDQVGITFKLNYGGSFIPVRLNNVIGKSQAYAAAIAAGIGIVFDMNLVDISDALSKHQSPPGRLKVLDGIKNTRIIDDTFNATPLGMEAALQSLKTIKAKRKIAVLGDMLELGEHTLRVHEDLGKKLKKQVDFIVTVGMRGKFIHKGAKDAGVKEDKLRHCDTVGEAGMFLQDFLKEEDVILFKASGKVRLENAVKEIMAKPEKAKELLVRQSKNWQKTTGIYE